MKMRTKYIWFHEGSERGGLCGTLAEAKYEAEREAADQGDGYVAYVGEVSLVGDYKPGVHWRTPVEAWK